jgi:hypothetical protein
MSGAIRKHNSLYEAVAARAVRARLPDLMEKRMKNSMQRSAMATTVAACALFAAAVHAQGGNPQTVRAARHT